MNKPAESVGVGTFFSASEAREERWRELHRVAKALAVGGGQADKSQAKALVEQLTPLEELCGYPGPKLMAQVNERLKEGDWKGLARLTQRISISLLSNSYRDDPEAWKSADEDDPHTPTSLPPSIGRGQARKPYFEVLVVSPGDRATWPSSAEGLRKLRRDTDNFVYEPVVVGSFEDAVVAVLVNFNIQAVVMFDGFGHESTLPLDDLRELLSAYLPKPERGADLGTLLARTLHAIRPELDVYLATDRDVGKLAGSEEAADIRRVFYALEEMLELHLAIMEGLADRYTTPYFD
ncbi:MAG TPA: decarboxylase, partial [Burkholderiales bacterium]